jgi:hypothetical protein
VKMVEEMTAAVCIEERKRRVDFMGCPKPSSIEGKRCMVTAKISFPNRDLEYYVFCKKETLARFTDTLQGLWVEEDLNKEDRRRKTERWVFSTGRGWHVRGGRW